jgi:hypothetical protein
MILNLCYYFCIVVVRNIKGLRKLSLPVIQGHDRGGSLRPFFIVLTVIVPHTLVSTLFWWRGRKGITLTQGGRVHEGATPSDKQTCILMVVAESFNSGLINKAVAHNKGRTPLWTVG